MAVERTGVAVRVRPGHRARVCDLSSRGARIETTCRLLPNSWIDLRIDIGDRQALSRASVMRCSICRLENGAPVYESALRFHEPLAVVEGLPCSD